MKKPSKKGKRATLQQAPVQPLPDRQAKRRHLTVEEWRAFLKCARAKSLEYEAMFLLLYECGLRREEVGKLRLSYAKELHKTGKLFCWRGKGSRSGWIELSESTKRVLFKWINKRFPIFKDRRPEVPIFPGKAAFTKGITGRSVYNRFRYVARKARLPKEVSHPHILKATRVQHLLEAASRDKNITFDRLYHTIAELIGHAAAKTTIEFYAAATGAEKQLVIKTTEELVK